MNKRYYGLKCVIAIFLALSMCLSITIPAQAVNANNAIAVGIDVSKHNQGINWGQVAQSGVSFAFIKAGSTNKGIDPYFDANMKGAQKAGIKTGVYLYSYATNVEQAQNEANLLVSWLSNYTVNFPIVYDVENSCMYGLSSGDIQAMISSFCNTVSTAGYYPMVYSYKNLYEGKIGNVGYDKWVAQYSDSCTYGGSNIAFWQSSSSASIAGIPTGVDFDYQYKDYSDVIIPDGFTQRNGQTMFFAGYKMQRGWVSFNDTKYYLDANGFLQKGTWYADESGTYYLTPADGSIARGQFAVDGQNYYFDANGVRMTGFVGLETGIYFYAPDTGIMVKNWYNDGVNTYYFDNKTGCMYVGPNTIQKKNYYFNEKGILQAGPILREDGQKYYYNPSDGGAMMFGWINDGTNIYYAAKDGHMVMGINQIDKKSYYFNENCILQVNQTLVLDGITYSADAEGVLTTVQ